MKTESPCNGRRDFSDGPIWDPELERWVAEVRLPDGSRKRHRSRRERELRRWWASEERKIEEGTWSHDCETTATLGDTLGRYEMHARVHHRSFKTYTFYGILFLQSIGKTKKLAAITKADIERVKMARLRGGTSKQNIDRLLAVGEVVLHLVP